MTEEKSDQEGGNAWALSQAEQGMIDAGLAGDAEKLALEMRRHTEATRNMIQAELVPPFILALGSMLDRKLDPIRTHQDRQYSFIDDQLRLILSTTDKRFDTYASDLAAIRDALDTNASAVSEAVRGLKKLVEGISADLLNMHEDVDQLKRDHIEFRTAQNEFSAQIETQGTNFDEYKRLNDERWRNALKTQGELREIIERKERQILGLIQQVTDLAALVTANTDRIKETQQRALVNEITLEERRTLLELNRWLLVHKDQIMLKSDE